MGLYQGRALRAEAPKRRRRGRIRRVLQLLALLVIVAGLAHVPWSSLRRTFAVVSHVEIQGLHYLDAATVQGFAGVHEGQDLLTLDLDRARQDGIKYVVVSSFTYDRFFRGSELPNQDDWIYQAHARYVELFRYPFVEFLPAYRSIGFTNPVIRIVDIGTPIEAI